MKAMADVVWRYTVHLFLCVLKGDLSEHCFAMGEHTGELSPVCSFTEAQTYNE